MHNGDSSEHIRMAYMDGELSELDRREYEKGLTAQQKKTIALDKRIQHSVVDRLKRIDRCPDDLWERARSSAHLPSQGHRTRQIFKLSAVAACLFVGFGLFYVNYALSHPIEVQVSLPEDVEAFSQGATIKGDQEAIEDVLHGNGFRVSIGDIATCNRQHRHRVALLGMRMMKLGDREYPCAQLRFSCCRRPVTTFVVKESPRITVDSFKTKEPSRQVHRMSHNANGYLIVTMSYHPVNVVGSLFEIPLPNGREP